MRAYREAIEGEDDATLEALLAEDVTFTSPAAFKPYAGKPMGTRLDRIATEAAQARPASVQP